MTRTSHTHQNLLFISFIYKNYCGKLLCPDWVTPVSTRVRLPGPWHPKSSRILDRTCRFSNYRQYQYPSQLSIHPVNRQHQRRLQQVLFIETRSHTFILPETSLSHRQEVVPSRLSQRNVSVINVTKEK